VYLNKLNPTNPHDKAYLDYMAFRLDTLATNVDSLSPASCRVEGLQGHNLSVLKHDQNCLVATGF